MDLRLTDLLACPRCGPPHGLVLLADRVEDRRVLEGVLGCPNCRGRWTVRAGLADLRMPGEAAGGAPGEAPPAEGGAAEGGAADAEPVRREAAMASAPEDAPADAATRLAALMGLAGTSTVGRALALVVGPSVDVAAELATVAPDVLVVAADPTVVGWDERMGVERILVGGRLPFMDRSLRGVTLSGAEALPLVEEALRVLHPLGRLVVEAAGAPAALLADARARVERAGGRVLAAEGETLVASPLPG